MVIFRSAAVPRFISRAPPGAYSASINEAALFLDNSVGGAVTPFIGGVMAGTGNYSF